MQTAGFGRRKTTRWSLTTLFLCITLSGCGGNQKKFNPKQAQDDPLIYYQKGVKYLNEGQCDLATQEFQRSMRLDDTNSVVINAFGLSQYCLTQYDEAIRAYKLAIKLNPFYTDVHNNLGIVYMETGELDSALIEFTRALRDRNYQTPEVVYFNMGLVYFKQENFAKAAGEIRKALELQPARTQWRLQYAKTLEKLEQFDEVKEECLKILEEDPENVHANFLLARLFVSLKRPDKSCHYLDRVVRLVPETDIGRAAAQMTRDNACERVSSPR